MAIATQFLRFEADVNLVEHRLMKKYLEDKFAMWSWLEREKSPLTWRLKAETV